MNFQVTPIPSPTLSFGVAVQSDSDSTTDFEVNQRLTGGGGGEHPPEVFFAIAKKRRQQRRRFLHSCSDNCSATFLKILGPGHQRSGHQVRSSDPTSEKLYNRAAATVHSGVFPELGRHNLLPPLTPAPSRSWLW